MPIGFEMGRLRVVRDVCFIQARAVLGVRRFEQGALRAGLFLLTLALNGQDDIGVDLLDAPDGACKDGWDPAGHSTALADPNRPEFICRDLALLKDRSARFCSLGPKQGILTRNRQYARDQ
jgi:hypothetical protein